MALDSKGNWQPWFDWETEFLDKLKNQSRAAAPGGRMVEWHVLQKEIADAIRPLAAPYTNVHVIYDPMPPEWWSGIK